MAEIASGGKAVYGAKIGILMLEARFPRIPGDIGNANTWPFPVLYKVVSGASPDQVVRRRAEGLLPAFIDAAEELVRIGADGITTNCGFLSLYQHQLAQHCQVPIATSALMQAPLIKAMLPPDQQLGIITISAANLDQEHLACAGVAENTPVVGTDDGREFSRVILDDEPELNIDLARQDILNAGQRLINEHENIGAVLLECTNMCPYSHDVQRTLKLPVFDMVTFIRWFHSSLQPVAFH